MPIASPPNRGFQEFQRTAPWDSGLLFSSSDNALPDTTGTTPIDVSRYAYLGGFDEARTAGAIAVNFNWYSDQATAALAGQRIINLAAAIGYQAQYRLPNLGPFLVVRWASLIAGATHTCELIGTNRSHPCELIPANPVLIDQDTAAIGGSATVTVYPSDYYAGPVMVWSTIGGGGTVLFQYLSSDGVWSTIQQWPVAALTNVQTIVVAPPGAWRFQVKNGSGSAGTYNLKVTPSLTGSS